MNNKGLVYIIALILLILIFFRSRVANSQELYTKQKIDNFNPYIGILVNITNLKKLDLFGVDIGYQIYAPYFLALEISHVSQELSLDVFNRVNALVKISYNFKNINQFFSYSYFGLGLGSSFYNRDSNNVVVSFFGLDIPLSTKPEFLSLGADVKYVWYSDIENMNDFSTSAILKYWF